LRSATRWVDPDPVRGAGIGRSDRVAGAARLVDRGLSSLNVSYTYDPVGNRVSMTDSTGTTSYSYDHGDQLQSATGPNGATSYQRRGSVSLRRAERFAACLG